MRFIRAMAVMAALYSVAAQPAYVKDDAAGQLSFENQCSICHITVNGKNEFGPSLAGVIGRRSGALSDYPYSSAMLNAGLTWDAEALDAFLASSTPKVPGTVMAIAIADRKKRADLIAYLATLGSPPKAGGNSSKPKNPPVDGPSDEELLKAADDPHSWLCPNKDLHGQRYVIARQINRSNAFRLRPT